MDIHYQDPNATEQYVVNWATRLPGITISSATFVAPDGPTLTAEGNTTTTHYVKASVLTDGTAYPVTSRVTDSNGYIHDYTFLIIGRQPTTEPAYHYAGTNELKAYLSITDTTDDALLEVALEAAAQVINAYTGRRFDAVAASTRYYVADDVGAIYVDDLVSVTTLKTDEDGDGVFERTWATTDYQLYPYNAAAYGLPYTQIRRTPDGDYWFPKGGRYVQIVGTFGYSGVPAAVRQACLLLAAKNYKRKDAIFGVGGSGDMGQLVVQVPQHLDSQIKGLLSPFMVGPFIV
jgi:hypothetical protein